MIDHVGLNVSDYEASKALYLAALKPLGYELVMEVGEAERAGGFGEQGKPDFWIGSGGGSVTQPVHVAFRAKDRATVRAFHEAALRAGARGTGAPGLREIYHPTYYGAFVLDPDGHNIEAVCHHPE
jgi:catechol 2,3-dioxygenase-like lactoylglutathione lyase family enzyme